MGLPVGTDLYGAIEQIGNTSIKTKFIMIAFLPVIPLESYYYLEGSETQGNGVPLIYRSEKFKAVQMTNLNWKSVCIGYLGAWAVGLFLAALIALFWDWHQTAKLVGIVFLMLCVYAYVNTRTQSSKESIIVRTLAVNFVGIALDPKFLELERKRILKNYFDELWIRERHGEFDVDRLSEYPMRKIALSLIRERFTEGNSKQNDELSSRLIEELRNIASIEASKHK